MRPLLVGMLNSRTDDPDFALWPEPRGCSGGRLCAVFGMTRDEYLATFERTNLCISQWSDAVARARAAEIMRERVNDSPIVMLGALVAGAFGFPYRPFSSPDRGLVILPHPSGMCRIWNDKASAQRAREAVAALGVPVGREMS